MRVFLTGATGFIGSAIIPELTQAGHQVLGLTRSDAGARALLAAGAEVHRGALEDLDSLRQGAAQADAVIHCAFDHDFSNFLGVCEKDSRAIGALADALVGSSRPLLITSGVGMGHVPGGLAREDVFDADNPNPRKASEVAGAAAAERGVNVSVVRLPQVHDTRKQGLITFAIAAARTAGVSAYVGDGANRYAAVHLSDAARLYRLALEKQEPGARYNAVAEEGVLFRDVAETVGRGLKVPVKSILPEEVSAYFGNFGFFVGLEMSASGAQTQQRLGWQPTGPGLLADLEAMDYSMA